MHASIWQFKGNPDELLGSYEAMVAEIPAGNLCARHGLPEPAAVEDHPVHAAYVDGQRRSSAS